MDASAQDDHPSGISWLPPVVGAMILLTAASFATLLVPAGAWDARAVTLFVLTVALLKAALVVMFFMHLKDERSWKYWLCIPPVLLAIVLVTVLLPDIAWPTDYGALPDWTTPTDG